MSVQINGKFLIYAPASGNLDVNTVKTAAVRLARKLGMKVELVSSFNLKSIYVYYENSEGELIPVYFDYGMKKREKDVYVKLRNMLFVLSFHPKFSNLKSIRKEVAGIIGLS